MTETHTQTYSCRAKTELLYTMTVVVVGLLRQINTQQLQLSSENTKSGLILTRKIIRRRLSRKCHTHISGQYELHWIMSKATWHLPL